MTTGATVLFVDDDRDILETGSPRLLDKPVTGRQVLAVIAELAEQAA